MIVSMQGMIEDLTNASLAGANDFGEPQAIIERQEDRMTDLPRTDRGGIMGCHEDRQMTIREWRTRMNNIARNQEACGQALQHFQIQSTVNENDEEL
jgi:hypothetical protein